LPSQGGELHRMVRSAFRPEASFRVTPVWAPVAFCRRSPRTATLWTEARGGAKRFLNAFPGCPQGPHFPAHPSPHYHHALYFFTTPKPGKAQVLTAEPDPKPNLIGPSFDGSSDTPDAPIKPPWLFGLGVAWLVTLMGRSRFPVDAEMNREPRKDCGGGSRTD
jgi:hypothetical protein